MTTAAEQAPSCIARGPAALVVAHPGHELRVHGWLQRSRAQVFVLTDGSGASGSSRLDATSEVLARTGGRPGALYGCLSDRELYEWLLDGCVERWRGLAERLARAFVEEGVATVVGDASEGYNPAHDVCRMLIEAAIRLANSRGGAVAGNFDFSLIGAPGARPEDAGGGSVRLALDDAELACKLDAARGYQALTAEVEAVFAAAGPRAFRCEVLRPAGGEGLECRRWGEPVPFYESYGEGRVEAGVYRRVLRYREHVLPLARALEKLFPPVP